MKRIETLKIHGKRWFQKSYGNTYHTVTVIVNGEEMKSGITYGYGTRIKPLVFPSKSMFFQFLFDYF